jgi:hypothetical protein
MVLAVCFRAPFASEQEGLGLAPLMSTRVVRAAPWQATRHAVNFTEAVGMIRRWAELAVHQGTKRHAAPTRLAKLVVGDHLSLALGV